jgi:hypothetical protein
LLYETIRLIRGLWTTHRLIAASSTRVDGKFLGPNGTVPASQAVCSSLLEECFDITQEIKAQDESKHVADSLKPIFDRLTEIRRELEGFALTHRWSLRETDLWNYTLSLQEIDKMRVDGKFVDLEKNVPQGQYVSILFHWRSSYFRDDLNGFTVAVGALVPAAEVLWDPLSVTSVE